MSLASHTGLFAFILVATLLFTSNGIKSPEELKKMHELCVKESGYEGNYSTLVGTDAKKEGKCYVKCMFKNKGLIEDDGSMKSDVIKSYVENIPAVKDNPELKEKVFKSIDECATKVKPNPDDLCESAWAYFDCRHNAMKAKSK